MNDDDVDVNTREPRYGSEVEPPGLAASKKLAELAEIEDKDEQDFILIAINRTITFILRSETSSIFPISSCV